MLLYHPMLDPYHCAFRLSCIASDCAAIPLEWDRLKVLDFFATFPHLLNTFRLPQEMRSSRSALRSAPPPYEVLPSRTRLFFQLNEIQVAAARLLVGGGMFDRQCFQDGVVKLTSAGQESRLTKIIEHAGLRTAAWYQVLTKQLCAIPLNGRNGLKERSGLMEFRHDAT